MLDVLVYQITEIQKHRSDLPIGLTNQYSSIIINLTVFYLMYTERQGLVRKTV